MQSDSRGAHALIFETERAAGIAFGAQRLEADEKSFEALLTPFEQAMKLPFAASGDIRYRPDGLVDQDVMSRTVGKGRHHGCKADIHHNQGGG
jgi:hypothetical protein